MSKPSRVIAIEKNWHLKAREGVKRADAPLRLVSAKSLPELDDCPRFMTLDQIKDLLGVSHATLDRAARRGDLEVQRVGRSRRVARSSLARYLITENLKKGR